MGKWYWCYNLWRMERNVCVGIDTTLILDFILHCLICWRHLFTFSFPRGFACLTVDQRLWAGSYEEWGWSQWWLRRTLYRILHCYNHPHVFRVFISLFGRNGILSNLSYDVCSTWSKNLLLHQMSFFVYSSWVSSGEWGQALAQRWQPYIVCQKS